MLEERLADTIAEEAVAADADKAFGQDVLQEAAAESGTVEGSGLGTVAVGAITVTEGNGLAVVADQAAV